MVEFPCTVLGIYIQWTQNIQCIDQHHISSFLQTDTNKPSVTFPTLSLHTFTQCNNTRTNDITHKQMHHHSQLRADVNWTKLRERPLCVPRPWKAMQSTQAHKYQKANASH